VKDLGNYGENYGKYEKRVHRATKLERRGSKANLSDSREEIFWGKMG
jgi:hypothetical protein